MSPSLSLFSLRPRLFASIGAALAAFFAFPLLPFDVPLTGRVLVAWNLGTFLYLGMAWRLFARWDVGVMRERARREDEGAGIILAITIGIAVASLAAIVAELAGMKGGEANQGARLALAGLTILGSWFFLHTVLTIHYAHEYYGDDNDDGDDRGLEFPGEGEPDYLDFMYFAFTIGAASQTSDVAVSSRPMRRLVLVHTIVSFLFNTTILALVINVGAGLLSGGK